MLPYSTCSVLILKVDDVNQVPTHSILKLLSLSLSGSCEPPEDPGVPKSESCRSGGGAVGRGRREVQGASGRDPPPCQSSGFVLGGKKAENSLVFKGAPNICQSPGLPGAFRGVTLAVDNSLACYCCSVTNHADPRKISILS